MKSICLRMLEPIPLPVLMKSPVTVVCHDAGAAHLLFAWLRHWFEAGALGDHSFKMVLGGPAEKAWKNNPIPLPHVQMHATIRTAVEGSQCVLSGTGWASALEHEARQLASELAIISVAVIDHWVNYAQRFERQGIVVLPDQIWVADQHAERIANQVFTSIPVSCLPNVYLQNLVKNISPVTSGCRHLLYVLEPVRDQWGRGEPGEFQALDFFVKHLTKVVGFEPVKIILRPHPSDPPEKYHAWIQANAALGVQLDQQFDLCQSIAASRWVVGVESYALVVASEAGRETFSSLPPWSHRCRLPIDRLVHIQDLVIAN